MPEKSLYLGLMSGTSIDSVDAVLADFCTTPPKVLGHLETEISAQLRKEILALSAPGSDHVDRLGQCDNALGELFARAANNLLEVLQCPSDTIVAIGSHGQTVRHRPPQTGTTNPFTLQIGDPNIIAARTGITTVADFRRRDMALGGQGAPLVPAFHHDAFASPHTDRVILNIGGIANITWLPNNGNASGFDTGPGNMLMDAWCLQCTGKGYDDRGRWAASGSVQAPLLKKLLAHPFLAQCAPKSTGREEFNRQWLARVMNSVDMAIPPQDVQATLLELTAHSIADSIKALSLATIEVYVCGGGALNTQLMTRLQALLPNCKIATTDALGVGVKLVEGVAFAWLAKRTLQKLTGNLPTATGASEKTILGAIYPANK